MDKIQLSQTSCPTCNGAGYLTNPEGALSCPECLGSGAWLASGETRLIFQPPHHLGSGLSEKTASQLFAIGTNLTALVGLFFLWQLILASWSDPLRIFWQQEPAALGFGIFGVLTIIGFTAFSARRHQGQSITNLEPLLSTKPDLIPINPYLHSRVIRLLNAAAAHAQGQNRSVVTDTDLFYALANHNRILTILARLELLPNTLQDRFPISGLRGGKAELESSASMRILAGFQKAVEEGFTCVDLEDLFLTYLDPAQPNQFSPTLEELGISAKKFLTVTRWYAAEAERAQAWAVWKERGRNRPKSYMNRGWTALPTPTLDQYSEDLTVAASMGMIATGFGYQKEIDSALEVLSGGKVQNVLFVGDPGSDVDELVQVIATQMTEAKVPEKLQDKRLVRLDLPRLLTAGSEPMKAMQQIVDEVAQAGNVILALPELKAIAEGNSCGLDSATVLANALQGGEIQVISTASFADYHRYLESNHSLVSNLQIIELHDLTPEEAIPILEDKASDIEFHFKVWLTYPALETAAKLAPRYLTTQATPGNAVELLETAAKNPDPAHWVTKAAVQRAVEKLTNVPVATATGAEADKLLNLESQIHTRVIGQDQAVKAVADALRRTRAGLTSPNRPAASFLFVGPTGVGKTELAKALAANYFKSEEAMVRFDMSEYQEPSSIYQLIGNPNDSQSEGGTLTQAVREHPFSLLLFDEIEKAHPDVLNLFLQILDDARLTENTGRVVKLQSCIIIATSNAGSKEISQLIKAGRQAKELVPTITRILENNFKPEFLNRFDSIIPFQPLDKAQLNQIAALMITSVQTKAAEQNITLTVTPEAISRLVELGYDPAYGARPLRRTIEQKLEGVLANALLNGTAKAGDTLQITADMLD